MNEKVLLEDIGKMMDEKLEASNATLRHEIIQDFNTAIENKVTKEIRFIAEQHGDIIARLPDVEEQVELKRRIRVLERVATDLRIDVENLKKAQ